MKKLQTGVKTYEKKVNRITRVEAIEPNQNFILDHNGYYYLSFEKWTTKKKEAKRMTLREANDTRKKMLNYWGLNFEVKELQ